MATIYCDMNFAQGLPWNLISHQQAKGKDPRAVAKGYA